jgi:DNA helicase-2/ATP-dependent DNA helicase PcrA
VELAIETVVDGIAVRGRIDAVFARDDGAFTIVDWKTGAEPTGEQARLRAVQLGAYALAYARLHGLPPDAVNAAFYYAQSGRTVRPGLPGEGELLALLQTVPA